MGLFFRGGVSEEHFPVCTTKGEFPLWEFLVNTWAVERVLITLHGIKPDCLPRQRACLKVNGSRAKLSTLPNTSAERRTVLFTQIIPAATIPHPVWAPVSKRVLTIRSFSRPVRNGSHARIWLHRTWYEFGLSQSQNKNLWLNPGRNVL